MAEKEKYGAMKRFGVRYGRINKLILAKLEAQYRVKNKCPYCRYVQVKRISAGIWRCGKCKAKFTGRAYSPPTAQKASAEGSA